VLGYGPGRTNVSVTRYLPSTFCNPYRVNDVHNVVLQVLVTTGVLGALTIGWWAWAGARRAKGPAAYAAVALLVVAMLEPFALVTALPTAAFVALACPAVTLDRRRRSSLVVGVLMVPAVLASAVLVIGMDAFNTANVGADPVAYRTASRLLPPWPEVAVSGVLANVLDSHDAAFAAARDAIRRAPGDSIGWTRLAALEARFGSVERAKEDFGQALRLDPADKEAKESLWTLNGEPDACPGAKQPALLPASGG
jgi:tetratricopeptide (TPR) repeat protein